MSERWLQNYVNNKYKAVPREIVVTEKPKDPLTMECDEMWSFVDNKGNKQWIWLAIDKDTKECIGVYISSRDRTGAQGLWDSLPAVYRQCAVAYADYFDRLSTSFGQHMKRFFHLKGIKLLGKKRGKQTTLNASIIRLDSEFQD